jgi:3-methylcrotonyl-CoA carboxylase beta subunit
VAKILMEKIGKPLAELGHEDEFINNQETSSKLNSVLISLRGENKQGWGQKYIDRVHAKGKLTTWERIDRLKDRETEAFPVHTFVNHGKLFGEKELTSPSAGVITAFLRVQSRLVLVIANDNTVASGAWWPMTPEKIERAQEIALQLRIPVIYLVDCSGLYLPEQAKTFPGKKGAGHIFKMNSLLSASGVPQIAAVMGDCIAGGGYMPIISDKLFMTEKAYMVIAGAALVRGGKSQIIESLDIGGPDIHVDISQCADERISDDKAMIQRIRSEVSKLPTSAVSYYRYGNSPAPPNYSPAEILSLIPPDHRRVYDIKEVLARLVDSSEFWELMSDRGEEMITGIARINGLYVGIIGNNPLMTSSPEDNDRKRPGGILYREGIAKISQFSRLCNDDGIPIVWLQDISGFDIGLEAEKHGLLGYGSNLIYTNSTNTVPMITVLLRKASGAGYYAMAGLPYAPAVQLSTPLTRLAVMEGQTLAIGAFRTKLDENFNIISDDESEIAQIKKGMHKIEETITRDMDPYAAASQMDTDEIVALHELRDYLSTFVELCYQNSGYRRIKNPRIWSMHDLKLISN